MDEVLDAGEELNNGAIPATDQENPNTRDDYALVDEMAKSRAHAAKPEAPASLELAFHGTAREYFRIWIVNICLTLLTLGLYSAWAKVRKQRYIYSHTTLGGTPFQYLGQPLPIFKGRLIAAAGFLLYYVSMNVTTYLLPFVLVAGLVALPWMIVNSLAFSSRYSSFRNMTFRFHGTYKDAAKVLYSWGLMPLLVVGLLVEWVGQPILLGVTAFFSVCLFPWWLQRLKRFVVSHTSFGGRRGEFSATGGQFFRVYLMAALRTIALVLLALVFFMAAFGVPAQIAAILSSLVLYVGYVIPLAYVRAHIGNLGWNHTRLGPLRFQSTLRFEGLLGLYVLNALGIIFSLGLLIPWAVMRTLRYRLANLRVVQEGDLGAFLGGDKSHVAAAGAEATDFFDIDLSL